MTSYSSLVEPGGQFLVQLDGYKKYSASVVVYEDGIYKAVKMNDRCGACGTGLDGSFIPSEDVTLPGGREYSFSSFSVPENVTVTFSSSPVVISVQGDVEIAGTISVKGLGSVGGAGGNGANYDTVGNLGKAGAGLGGGLGGAIGKPGSGAGFSLPGGATADLSGGATYKVGERFLATVGSGGGGGGGQSYTSQGACRGGAGGAGGGFLSLVSETLTVKSSGIISADGNPGGCGQNRGYGTTPGASGGGGSGGTIWIRAGAVTIDGNVHASGGPGGNCYSSIGGTGSPGVVVIDTLLLQGESEPAHTSSSSDGVFGHDSAYVELHMENTKITMFNRGPVEREFRIDVVQESN